MVEAWEEKLKIRQEGGDKVDQLGSKESLLKGKVLYDKNISEGAFVIKQIKLIQRGELNVKPKEIE